MRAFIAIDISESFRGVLERVEASLKYAGADVKWADPASIHLTLKFLGEINDEKCADVKSALDAIAGSVRPFEMTLKALGAFPEMRHPRVIWVGLDRGASEATALAGLVESALSELGFAKEERPFSPHLTIGRVRSPLNRDKLIDKISSVSAGFQPSDAGSYKVSSIILFQSTLTPKGSIYSKLHEAQFTQ
ncbi:MAG: RNA 2',3'-cyclic phosphodiesterase [Candidatus Omnitrophica bacterium]|nr:RNA 2',3'-cyclic phosphodiesterase [Candidatus Omnitrophota bacterium]